MKSHPDDCNCTRVCYGITKADARWELLVMGIGMLGAVIYFVLQQVVG